MKERETDLLDVTEICSMTDLVGGKAEIAIGTVIGNVNVNVSVSVNANANVIVIGEIGGEA